MDKLIQDLKKNPSNLKIIPQIMHLLLTSKQPQSTKLKVVEELLKIISKLFIKIQEKKQAQTYKYIQSTIANLLQVVLSCSTDSQDTQKWLTLAYSSIKVSRNEEQLIAPLLQGILDNQGIQPQHLLDGDLLTLILKGILAKNNDIKYAQISKLILNIQHFNNLNFEEQPNLEDKKLAFKLDFQNILINCLEQINSQQVSEQISIYHSLGDKVFSKLASPLILSEFLIRKFKNEEQNPGIQIEVLSCLFILVGKYGLQLEKFYENLENMMDSNRKFASSLFKISNSKRFLKLIQAAMRSSKVPFHNILSLSHLLLNRILNQRSELAFWALSFLVNLVKKHRQLQAHLSEFPELDALKYHYSPKIRMLVKELSKNLNKSEYLDIEDFSKINCQRLCDKKFEEVIEKIISSEDKLQFKLPKLVNKL